MSESAGKAVFLSYASQDAVAALRICEALRAAGVEVWLDQEGGLVGGDAWDRKIRDQIATCTLFVALISANTQARKEGYFRLEWHLAEERARLIAKGVPFIVPVSIDGTAERGALVPDAFLAVQWTKLPGGEAPAAFVARVGKLLAPAEVARAFQPVSAPNPDTGSKARATAVGNTHLAEPLPPSAHFTPVAQPRAGRERRWQFATAVALVVATGMAFVHFRQTPPPPQTFRYTLSGPPGCTLIPSFAISPDGKSVVMVAIVSGKRQLWLRALDGLEIKPLPSTEEASNPFWSPDGRSIGFFTQDKLKKVAVSGGPAQTLCDAPGTVSSGGSWSRDNGIVFVNGVTEQIQRVAAGGGVPVDVTKTEMSRRLPAFLPDGRRFLWTTRAGVTGKGIFVTSLDGKEERRLVEGDILGVRFAPGERRNHVLFVREATLMALPFDPASAKATGDAFPVAENVRGSASVTASRNGVLIYAPVIEELGQISWFDRSGKLLGPVSDSGLVAHPALSPDEKRVIFRRGNSRRGELWLRDLERGAETRLTSGAHDNGFPMWSPKGDRIMFGSDRDGVPTNLYQRAANGSGQEELLLPTRVQQTPSQWSRDGQFIVYSQRTQAESLWVLPLNSGAGPRTPVLFLQAETNSMFGQISPDGRWMAFTSNRSGPRNVYVRPFPSGDGDWPVSIAGGQAPRWRADGKEMFYVAPDGKMMAVPVNAAAGAKPTFEAGVPVALFATTMLSAGEGRRPHYQYDVTADGSRFLIAHSISTGAPPAPTLTVVTNWLAGLEQQSGER